MDGNTAAALSSNQPLAMAVITGLCILVAGLSIVAWALIVRTLMKLDKSISKAHSRLDVLGKEHYELAGAHKTRMEMGGCSTGGFDSGAFGKALGEGLAIGLKQARETL